VSIHGRPGYAQRLCDLLNRLACLVPPPSEGDVARSECWWPPAGPATRATPPARLLLLAGIPRPGLVLFLRRTEAVEDDARTVEQVVPQRPRRHVGEPRDRIGQTGGELERADALAEVGAGPGEQIRRAVESGVRYASLRGAVVRLLVMSGVDRATGRGSACGVPSTATVQPVSAAPTARAAAAMVVARMIRVER
jgi:hypothetical protein